jgi:hypothetical protein
MEVSIYRLYNIILLRERSKKRKLNKIKLLKHKKNQQTHHPSRNRHCQILIKSH